MGKIDAKEFPSFELMVETESIEALSSLASASCKITQGEFQQMQIANKPETSQEDYFEVIGKKTAELFGASCKSGVIVAGGNIKQQNAAYDYGFNLGLAFQIIDDLMDFNNLPNKMGKNLGDDFKLGKTTLPVILAWQKSNPKEKKFWIKILHLSMGTHCASAWSPSVTAITATIPLGHCLERCSDRYICGAPTTAQ